MIPRLITQIYIGPNALSERDANWCLQMKRMNPTWTHRLLGNELLERYGNDPYVKRLLEMNASWAFVCDRLRILILAEEGGIYIDTDAQPIRPLDTLKFWDRSTTEFVYGIRNPNRPGVALHRGVAAVDNTVLASAPQSRMVRRLLDCWTPKDVEIKGHRIGITILTHADDTCVGLGYKAFYDMAPSPETILLHDPHNAGSWVKNPAKYVEIQKPA